MRKEQQNVSKMKNAHQKHVAMEQIKILTKYLTINFKIFNVAIISTKEDRSLHITILKSVTSAKTSFPKEVPFPGAGC